MRGHDFIRFSLIDFIEKIASSNINENENENR